MGQSFQKGNIFERRRGDGSVAFQLRYRIRAPGGIGNWEWQTETLPRSVTTKKQAERELASRLRPVNDAGGVVVGAGSVRFSELVDSYWPLYVAHQNMRPGTLDAYAAMMGKWIGPFFKDLALREITSAHVSRFLGKLDESGLASKYRRDYNLVNEIFEVALANGLILSNPVRSKIHRPEVLQEQEKSVLSSDQCWAVIAAVCEKRDKALLWTFMLTGMRQGEVFGLRRMDVDLEAKRITATHVLYSRAPPAWPEKTQAGAEAPAASSSDTGNVGSGLARPHGSVTLQRAGELFVPQGRWFTGRSRCVPQRCSVSGVEATRDSHPSARQRIPYVPAHRSLIDQ